MITFVLDFRGDPGQMAQEESRVRAARPAWRITHKGGTVYEVQDRSAGVALPAEGDLGRWWRVSPMRQLEISPPRIDLGAVRRKLAENGW